MDFLYVPELSQILHDLHKERLLPRGVAIGRQLIGTNRVQLKCYSQRFRTAMNERLVGGLFTSLAAGA